jgi:hypothetical protein
VDPAAAQPNAPMARPVQQVRPEHVTDVGQNRLRTRRVQPMASIIDPQAIDLEAAGVSADLRISLNYVDCKPVPSRKPKGRS